MVEGWATTPDPSHEPTTQNEVGAHDLATPQLTPNERALYVVGGGSAIGAKTQPHPKNHSLP